MCFSLCFLSFPYPDLSSVVPQVRDQLPLVAFTFLSLSLLFGLISRSRDVENDDEYDSRSRALMEYAWHANVPAYIRRSNYTVSRAFSNHFGRPSTVSPPPPPSLFCHSCSYALDALPLFPFFPHDYLAPFSHWTGVVRLSLISSFFVTPSQVLERFPRACLRTVAASTMQAARLHQENHATHMHISTEINLDAFLPLLSLCSRVPKLANCRKEFNDLCRAPMV